MADQAPFLARISAALSQLNVAEKRLAEFLSGLDGTIASYDAQELAKLAGVSKATVSRFVRRLGYASFDEARRNARGEQRPNLINQAIAAGNAGRAKRPTMMDVAALAEVSQATVSLVLNGGPGVKLTNATRRRVTDAAERLGYEFVNRGASSTAGSPGTIVFIADEVTTDPWMTLAFEGARDKALGFGINVCLTESKGNVDTEAMIVEQMSRLPVLGYIYGTILTRMIEVPQALKGRNTVLVNCYDAERVLPSMLPGDTLGGRAATERLLQAGCTRVAFINGQQGVDASRDRLKGYRQALASAEIPFDPTLVRPGNWEPASGYDMTLELMAGANPPDAIFCANDMMAVGCFDALVKLGIKVPDQVSVIGFDDREIAQFTRPPLTTLVLPHYEMGELAAERLIDCAGKPLTDRSHVKVECQIAERNSVRSASGHGERPTPSRTLLF